MALAQTQIEKTKMAEVICARGNIALGKDSHAVINEHGF